MKQLLVCIVLVTVSPMLCHRSFCTAFVVLRKPSTNRSLLNKRNQSQSLSNDNSRRIISESIVASKSNAAESQLEQKSDTVDSLEDQSNNHFAIFEQQQQRQSLLPAQKQQRRVRYNGKYPKHYNEKYKELNGDVHTIQKVLEKGMTPAGQHIPIMIDECLHHLGFHITKEESDQFAVKEDATGSSSSTSIRHNITFVDCTLGYGGHSSQVLKNILQNSKWGHSNKMICFDRDPIELEKATQRLQTIQGDTPSTNVPTREIPQQQDIISFVNRNFCELRTYLQEHNQLGTVTALLADLGVSSMQIDDATRGFTYKQDGPLDMRMSKHNATTPSDNNRETAYDLLCRLTVPEFTKILQENSDEVFASNIAEAVLGDGKMNIPTTTLELSTIVRDTVRPFLRLSSQSANNKSHILQQQQQQHQLKSKRKIETSSTKRPDSVATKKILDSTVARVMQAIRIEVNQEFASLEQLLIDLPYIMAPGGRVVFLTFHSGEDRRVKKALKMGYNNGIYEQWSRDVVRPSATERYNNSRSSCCKLRWAIRSNKLI